MENHYPTKELETRNLIWASCFVLLLIAGFYGMMPRTHGIPPYSTRISLADRERLEPGVFLVTTGTYKPNVLLTKWQITGYIANTAEHTNYKDVVVKVDFYSRSNVVVGSKECVLHEYFSCGAKKEFDLEVDRPAGSVGCGWQVVGARVY